MTGPSLEPTMAIEVPGHVTGPHVIDDLLARIEGALKRTNSLRLVDVYSGYSAKVEIRLQLRDINMEEVSTEIAAGTIDPQQPVKVIALDPDVAGVSDESQSLERPIDSEGFTKAPPKRQYVSRLR